MIDIVSCLKLFKSLFLFYINNKDKNYNNFKIEEFLSDVPLKQISRDVYSKSKDNYSNLEIRINEIEFIEYSFNVDGKKIKIKIPKDTPPPSEEFVKLLINR